MKVANSTKFGVSRRGLGQGSAQPINIRLVLHHEVTLVTVSQQCGCLCVLEVRSSNLRRYVLRFRSFHPDVGEYIKKNTGNCIGYFVTVVLFTVCTGCVVSCVVCIVVSCVVCIVASCVVCIVVVVLCVLL